VLPAAARLRHRDEYAATLRAGRRRTGGAAPTLLVAHVASPADRAGAGHLPCVGFIVARSVGGAVVRNRVRRRLRHLMAARLTALPAGCRVVVRALPAAAGASSPELAAALDQALAPGATRSVRSSR
jgi:ribonuclease P protein component